ncbi:helix-turn-helix domain-containing protein [Halobellus marinus]|uniref:helix-turn-helix domain-containing protein n=1 Tax=Halobellus TaxID=1073986 RepID=UPI003618C747
MIDLSHVTTGELRAALEDVERKKPTQRLTAAIAYKNGITQTELAEWYGVQRKTIYNWLTRFVTAEDSASLAASASDSPRPGRPRRLSESEFQRFRETLREPPENVGFDAFTWTPALVRQHLRETFDVEYSVSSARRFLEEFESGPRSTPGRATDKE